MARASIASLIDSHSNRPEALRSLGAAPPGGHRCRNVMRRSILFRFSHRFKYLSGASASLLKAHWHNSNTRQEEAGVKQRTFSCEHFDINRSLDTDLVTNL